VRFRAFHRGRFVLELLLQVPGPRHALSALAAIAASRRLEVPTELIREALEEFTGVSRDFESRGSFRGVTLIDDEGEDPAAVVEALQLGREVFGKRRLWAVLFAPEGPSHGGTRDGLVAALGRADEVLVAGPMAAEAAAGLQARHVASIDEAILELDRHLEPGDVLVTLGAGGVGTISDAFVRRLPHDRPAR
jgi:UDP-N-acetylmuramate--alanine ligase